MLFGFFSCRLFFYFINIDNKRGEKYKADRARTKAPILEIHLSIFTIIRSQSVSCAWRIMVLNDSRSGFTG